MLEKIKAWFRGEWWHYTCINGHKWKSLSSPGGGYYAPQTVCPACGSPICRGEVYIDGKKTGMGSIHRDFRNGNTKTTTKS